MSTTTTIHPICSFRPAAPAQPAFEPLPPLTRGRAADLFADETGAATAEYAVATMAAVAFAGLLVVIMRSQPTKANMNEPLDRYAPAMGKLKALGAAVLVTAALMFSGCAASSNETACKLYADGYNHLADAMQLKYDGVGDVDNVRAQLELLPSRFSDAFDKASGDVAVAMRASVESSSASVANLDSQDAGVAMYMDITAVQNACSADGAEIDLHEKK